MSKCGASVSVRTYHISKLNLSSFLRVSCSAEKCASYAIWTLAQGRDRGSHKGREYRWPGWESNPRPSDFDHCSSTGWATRPDSSTTSRRSGVRSYTETVMLARSEVWLLCIGLLCFLCSTSSMSLTGSYTEGELRNARSSAQATLLDAALPWLCENRQAES